MLDWRTIVPSREPAHMVRGTELEVCFPAGFLSRFAIYSVRTVQWIRDRDHWNGGYGEYDVRYRVRDAFTVSDADVKAGVRPKIFGEYATLDDALAAIEPHRHCEVAA